MQFYRKIDRTDFDNLAPYKMLEAFCSTSGISVYFTYYRYAESDKGGYQIEKLDVDHLKWPLKWPPNFFIING
jgi:hypothetical protein